jgi:hypothetical protein
MKDCRFLNILLFTLKFDCLSQFFRASTETQETFN